MAAPGKAPHREKSGHGRCGPDSSQPDCPTDDANTKSTKWTLQRTKAAKSVAEEARQNQHVHIHPHGSNRTFPMTVGTIHMHCPNNRGLHDKWRRTAVRRARSRDARTHRTDSRPHMNRRRTDTLAYCLEQKSEKNSTTTRFKRSAWEHRQSKQHHTSSQHVSSQV